MVGETSVKLDWFMDKVMGDWTGRKVIAFSRFKPTIRALLDRAREVDVGCAVIWGDTKGGSEAKAAAREAEKERFWRDPNCRIAIGTSAIERSLNLQVANRVVNIDMMLNPARMVQIAGRAKRAGSPFSHVFVYNLLCSDTQEDRYLGVLRARQALFDHVFDDEGELFEPLSALELLQLIRP